MTICTWIFPLWLCPSGWVQIRASEPGEGLLIYENVILPFRNPIPQRSQLYKIMTTRLGEGETV